MQYTYLTPQLLDIWDKLDDPDYRYYLVGLKNDTGGYQQLTESFENTEQEYYVTTLAEEEGLLSIYGDYESAELTVLNIIAQTKMKKSDFVLIRGNLSEMFGIIADTQKKMIERDGHSLRVEIQAYDAKGGLLARELVYSHRAPKH